MYHTTTEKKVNRDIVVEDDVWIGYDCLIMSGVTIGKGSVIGARSIVTKDVPPYSIFVGTKVIKTRFSEDIVQKSLKIDYSKIKHEQGDSYFLYCQQAVNEDNVDTIVKKFMCRKGT